MKEYITDKNHLGTMRFDYADGEYAIANRWSPYKTLTQEDIKEVQAYVNEIMFERFTSFTKIIDYCGGQGYSFEKTFYEKKNDYIYAIKLIPVKGEYNGYIYVYKKLKEVA